MRKGHQQISLCKQIRRQELSRNRYQTWAKSIRMMCKCEHKNPHRKIKRTNRLKWWQPDEVARVVMALYWLALWFVCEARSSTDLRQLWYSTWFLLFQIKWILPFFDYRFKVKHSIYRNNSMPSDHVASNKRRWLRETLHTNTRRHSSRPTSVTSVQTTRTSVIMTWVLWPFTFQSGWAAWKQRSEQKIITVKPEYFRAIVCDTQSRAFSQTINLLAEKERLLQFAEHFM